MTILVWVLVPLMFGLGQLQLADKVYFPHVALILLGVSSLVTRGMNARLPKAILGWLLLFLVATVFSTALVLELEALRASTQLMIFALAVILPTLLANDERSLRSLMLALLAGATINAVVGVVQSANWIANYGFVLIAEGEWFRVKGAAVTPVDYVMQLVIGLSLCELMKNQKLRNWGRRLFIVSLLFSNSRTALVILALFGLRALWLAGRGSIARAAIAFAIVIPVAMATAPGELVADRIADIFNPNFNIKRMVTYEYVIQRIFDAPEHLFLGHGYGTFTFYHPLDLEVYNNTHNMYLHVLFSGGVLGFVAFFGFLAYNIRYAFKFARITADRPLLASGAQGVLFLCLVILIGGLVETNLVGIGSGSTAGLCLGCALSGNRILRRNRHLMPSEKVHV
jgi:O-antigen ligase